MLYVGSNDAIEKEFEDSVNKRFHVKFLGPAQWFLQMRIHQHKDSTYTLDQHRYVLNTLHRYDPDSEFPERDTPLPTDYTFSKTNRPETTEDKYLVGQKYARLPFRSAVCTLLYLAYNTRADILFAVCKLAKHASVLETLTFVPSNGSLAISDAAHTMLSNSTQTAPPVIYSV